MDAGYLAVLAAGAAAGGLINGMAGFGTALFALSFWLHVMPPVQAVAIALIMSVLSGIQGVWIVRHSLRWRRLARFILPALVGIPVGLQFLRVVDAGDLKLVIAAFLLLYGSFFAFRKDLPNFERPAPILDIGVGFIGGVLGAAAGLSGALPTMYCALRPWPKGEARAVLQPFNVVVLGVAAVLLAFAGVYDREVLLTTAIALPVTMIFAQIGIYIFKYLGDDQFRRILIGLMFVSGAGLMLREMF